MGYLQLAEDPYMHLAEVPAQNMKFYVFIPAGYRGAEKDMYIREDVLDDLPEATYSQIMSELQQYQTTGLSDAKEDRKKRKADRNARKDTRANAGKTRQEARTKRQELRSTAKAQGGGKFADILGTVAGTAKDIFGKGNVDVNAGGGGFQVQYDPNEETFFSKYKIPLLLGGAALIGGTIYLLTRKK
jgi:hypothetical protein